MTQQANPLSSSASVPKLGERASTLWKTRKVEIITTAVSLTLLAVLAGVAFAGGGAGALQLLSLQDKLILLGSATAATATGLSFKFSPASGSLEKRTTTLPTVKTEPPPPSPQKEPQPKLPEKEPALPPPFLETPKLPETAPLTLAATPLPPEETLTPLTTAPLPLTSQPTQLLGPTNPEQEEIPYSESSVAATKTTWFTWAKRALVVTAAVAGVALLASAFLKNTTPPANPTPPLAPQPTASFVPQQHSLLSQSPPFFPKPPHTHSLPIVTPSSTALALPPPVVTTELPICSLAITPKTFLALTPPVAATEQLPKTQNASLLTGQTPRSFSPSFLDSSFPRRGTMPFDAPSSDLPSMSAGEFFSEKARQTAEKLAPVVEKTIYVAKKAIPVVKGTYSAVKTAGGAFLDVMEFTKPVRNLARSAFVWTFAALYARQQVAGGPDPFTVMENYLTKT